MFRSNPSDGNDSDPNPQHWDWHSQHPRSTAFQPHQPHDLSDQWAFQRGAFFSPLPESNRMGCEPHLCRPSNTPSLAYHQAFTTTEGYNLVDQQHMNTVEDTFRFGCPLDEESSAFPRIDISGDDTDGALVAIAPVGSSASQPPESRDKGVGLRQQTPDATMYSCAVESSNLNVGTGYGKSFDFLHRAEYDQGSTRRGHGGAESRPGVRRSEMLGQEQRSEHVYENTSLLMPNVNSFSRPPYPRVISTGSEGSQSPPGQPGAGNDDSWSPENPRYRQERLEVSGIRTREDDATQVTGPMLLSYIGDTARAAVQTESSVSENSGQYLLSPRNSSRELDSSSPSGSSTTSFLFLYCKVKDCHAIFKGEYKKGNLARHIRLKHVGGGRTYICEGGCGKIFNRQDARLKHYRRQHPRLASGPVKPRKV